MQIVNPWNQEELERVPEEDAAAAARPRDPVA